MQEARRRRAAATGRLASGIVAVGLSILTGSCAPRTDPHDKLTVSIGKAHALLQFLHALADTQPESPSLKASYEGTVHDTADTRALIAGFRAAVNTHSGGVWAVALAEASGASGDLDAFESSTRLLLPAPYHTALFAALRGLEPAFDALIWEPRRRELERQRVRLLRLARDIGLERLMDKAMVFYRADPPQSIKYHVHLVPLPAREGNAISSANGTAISLAVLEDASIPRLLGVAFHEVSHCLVPGRADPFWTVVRNFFENASSPYSAPALSNLGEAVATAFGAWIDLVIDGCISLQGPWYNDDYIDRYAKALYPRLVEYLDRGKPVDRGFCEYALARFQELFPESPSRYDSIFRSIFLSTDQVELFDVEVIPVLRRYFSAGDIEYESPIHGPEARRVLATTTRNVALVVTDRSVTQLASAVEQLSVLALYRSDLLATGRDALFATVDDNGRAIVVIKVDDPANLDRVLAAMEDERVDPERPFRYF